MFSKDVLGIILLKIDFKTVLNLRLTCKKYNEYITGYNKYWFLKVLPSMHLQSRHLKPSYNIRNKEGEYVKIGVYWLECVNLGKTTKEIDLEVVSHVDYKKWQEKFRKKLNFTETSLSFSSENPLSFSSENSLSFSSDKIAEGYYRGKYLKQKYPEHKCPNFSHWTNTPKEKWLFQENINLIHPAIIEYYDTNVNYFSLLIENKKK